MEQASCMRAILTAISVLCTGCFLWHAPSADEDGSDAGAAVDARSSGRTDSGSSDAGSAADAGGGPPLSDGGPLPDDEPDVRPGERPSDDPSSDEWTDPPPASDADPCCELVGEPVPLDDPRLQGGPPAVAWNGRGWGVAWRVFETDEVWFRELDLEARPLASPRTVAGVTGAWVGLAWGNHRYGLWANASRRTGTSGRFGILDAHGGLRAWRGGFDGMGPGRVARFAAVHGWAVAASDNGGEGPADIRVVLVDDAAEPLGPPIDIATATDFSDGVPAVAGLLSRVEVVWAGAGGARRVSVFPDGTMGTPGHLMSMHTYVDERGGAREGHAIVATNLRDAIVAAGADGSHIHVVVYDPFEDVVLGGPLEVADSPTIDARLGLAGDAKTGLVGLCYPYGDGPFGGYVDGRGPPNADEIRFQLLGPTGEPRGRPVVVVDGLGYAAGCAVGANSTEFVVVWWHADGPDPGPGIVAQRIRPR